jgi:CRISPR-associated endonuclease Cas2
MILYTKIFAIAKIEKSVYHLDMGKTYSYKGVKVNAFGIPKAFLKDKSIKNNKKKKNFYFHRFQSPFSESSPKNLLVIYDIPEAQKKERDWFRRQLKNYEYIMIQRSVWVGPSPLPKDFRDYVKSIGLKNKLKTFKLAKSYNIKQFNH